MSAPADLELDCRGLRCPLPVIKLGNSIGDVPVGGTVAVVADDPAAGPDTGGWGGMREHEFLGEDVSDDGVPRDLVRRC